MTMQRFRLPTVLLTLAMAIQLGPTERCAAESYTQDPPGVVIDHLPAETGRYIGSPSIAILEDGRYIASHDIFGPQSQFSRSRVFESTDGGTTWRRIAEIDGAFWSTLFVHRGALYLLGTSGRYKNTVIRRSDDGGRTWTTPDDSKTGLLQSDGGYHCAPQPVLVHNGRIWRAMEDNRGGMGWAKHFRAFVLSAPVDADLLDAANWTVSKALARNPQWLDGQFNGWLEGNVVATPDGHLVNVLRVDLPSGGGKAAIVDVSQDGTTVSFDPNTGFIDFPGGSTKFTIRFDPLSQSYWSLSNYIPTRHLHPGRRPGAVRNTLALIRSKTLRHWQVRSIVAYHHDVANHGFQYPDWQFEGDDIVAVSRTAHADGLGGAHNYHDANFLTFHRVPNFREIQQTELPPLPKEKTISVDGDEFSVTAIHVQIGHLAEQAIAFGNRDYVWKDVPSRFAGWRYLQTNGGSPAVIEVVAKRETILHVATAANHVDLTAAGWSVVPESTFHYTDHHMTQLKVYTKPVEKGQTVTVPQVGWTGSLLLLPP
jgi:hypothetical protein